MCRSASRGQDVQVGGRGYPAKQLGLILGVARSQGMLGHFTFKKCEKIRWFQ